MESTVYRRSDEQLKTSAAVANSVVISVFAKSARISRFPYFRSPVLHSGRFPFSAMSEIKIDSANEAAEKIEALTLEKKPKQRKAQTDAEFQAQKSQFQAAGPKIDTENWLFEENLLHSLDPTKKTDRVTILHACEKAYFIRDYPKCISLVSIGEKLFGVELDDEVINDELKHDFANAGRKTKKSSKVERHVMELLRIKEACLRKMAL